MMRMVMKMAAVSTISLLLLCCWAVSSTDSQDACTYTATGSSYNVPLNHKLGKSEILTWKHNNNIVFSRRPSGIISGKTEDIDASGALKLTNLKKTNAGKYTPEVFDENGKQIENLKSTTLCVLDPVLKPKVKQTCIKATSVKFTCEVTQNVKDLSFKWFQNNKELEKEKGQTLMRTEKQVESNSFSCNVSNQVSSMTSDSVPQICFKRNIFPEKLFGINTWIFVGVGGGVVVLLIVIIIVCCICSRRKRRMQIKDEGEFRLDWASEQQHHHQHQPNRPPDQPHHHQHHHRPQQQPAGHTGPRQHRSKQPRDQQRPRAPDHNNGQPQPSPRRPAQAPRPPVDITDEEQPPPLPQPRKKAPKTARV